MTSWYFLNIFITIYGIYPVVPCCSDIDSKFLQIGKSSGFQWRIQDFPEVGRQLPRGAPTYHFAKFSQKLHEIERIWTPGASLATPLDPPLNSSIHFINIAVVHMESIFNVFLISRVRVSFTSECHCRWRHLQSLCQRQLCLFVYIDANIMRKCKSPPIALSEGPTTKKATSDMVIGGDIR